MYSWLFILFFVYFFFQKACLLEEQNKKHGIDLCYDPTGDLKQIRQSIT